MPDLCPLESSEIEMHFGWFALKSRAEKQDRGRSMDSTVRDLLLIILFGLAEAFMVWTLWNFLRSGRRRSSASRQYSIAGRQFKRTTN
jgi:hypothetical protein